MGVFSRIKDLFKPKTKMLPEGYINNDTVADTVPLICLETLEYILKDNKAYKRYKKNDEYFFDNGITQDDYKKAFSDYAEFLLRRGVHFKKRELQRINKITGKDYSKTEKCISSKGDTRALVGEMIRNPDLLEEFQVQNSNDTKALFKGKYPDEIKQEMLYSVDGMKSETRGVYSIRLDNYARQIGESKTIYREEFREFQRESIDRNKEVDPNLHNLIISKIPQGIKDKEELSYCIYNAVNECVLYDSTYFALNKNRKDYNIRKLFQKDISDVTMDRNNVICETWAKLYSYYLQLYGLKSTVVSEIIKQEGTSNGRNTKRRFLAAHKYVEIYTDDQIIKADATNVTTSQFDRSSLSDLTRTKLNLMPAGFESKHYKELSEKYHKRTISEKVSEITSLISEREHKNRHGVDNAHEISDIERNLEIMSDEIKKSKLDNMANVQYMRVLNSTLFGSRNNRSLERTHLSHSSVYTQDKEGRCYFKPIMSVNIGSFERPEYRYVILDNPSKGLQSISKEEIERSMMQGVLKAVKGKRKIDGIDYDRIDKSMKKEKNTEPIDLTSVRNANKEDRNVSTSNRVQNGQDEEIPI